MDLGAGIVLAGEITGAVLTILGVVRIVGWKIIGPIKKKIDTNLQAIHDGVAKIDLLAKEFQPNGGSSMKDHLSRITTGLNELQQAHRAQMAYEDHGIFETDNLGRCTYANRAYLRMLGVDFDEVEMGGWRNFIAHDCKTDVFTEWGMAVQDMRDFNMTYKMVRADGEEVCVSCAAFAIRNEKKELVKYIGAITLHDGLEKCSKKSA